MAKKSATQIAAENEYLRQHGIQTYQPVKQKKVKIADLEPTTGAKVIVSRLGLGDLKDFGIYMRLNFFSPILIHMTDREIVENLLEYYSNVLNRIIEPEMQAEPVKMKEFLNKHHCQEGVCYCSRRIFGVKITDAWFITQWCDPNGSSRFWFTQPEWCFTSKDMIRSISLRVNRLQEILNSMQ